MGWGWGGKGEEIGASATPCHAVSAAEWRRNTSTAHTERIMYFEVTTTPKSLAQSIQQKPLPPQSGALLAVWRAPRLTLAGLRLVRSPRSTAEKEKPPCTLAARRRRRHCRLSCCCCCCCRARHTQESRRSQTHRTVNASECVCVFGGGARGGWSCVPKAGGSV